MNIHDKDLQYLNNRKKITSVNGLTIESTSNDREELLYHSDFSGKILCLPQKYRESTFNKDWKIDPGAVINKFTLALLLDSWYQGIFVPLLKDYLKFSVSSIAICETKAYICCNFTKDKLDYSFYLTISDISDWGALTNIERLDCKVSFFATPKHKHETLISEDTFLARLDKPYFSRLANIALAIGDKLISQ